MTEKMIDDAPSPQEESPQPEVSQTEESEVIKTSPAKEAYLAISTYAGQLQKVERRRDHGFVNRILRKTQLERGKLNLRVLELVCRRFGAEHLLSQIEEIKEDLLDLETEPSEDLQEIEIPERSATDSPPTPELLTYLNLLIVQFLNDQKFYDEAAYASAVMFDDVMQHNRRSLDLLSSKVFYWYSVSHERNNSLASIREKLVRAYRTASLQHNEPGQATLAVQILRSFLLERLYDEADRFRRHIQFPFDSATQQQQARWLFYLGQLDAMQLRYSDSLENLQQALRRVPHTAIGFIQACHKTLVLVQLLTGEIPDRSVFSRSPELRQCLEPFLRLTQAVRIGDLKTFTEVSEQQKAFQRQQEQAQAALEAVSNAQSSALPTFGSQNAQQRNNNAPLLFRQPSTSSVTMSAQSSLFTSLIARLRHNVIKTGLRRICQAYNRISLRDIAILLKMIPADSPEKVPETPEERAKLDRDWFLSSGAEMAENVEFIVSKSIADGVIDAHIDRETGTLITKTAEGLYNTDQPAAVLHRRILLCNSIRDQAVKAMAYPADFMRRPVGGKIGEVDDDSLDMEIDDVLDGEDHDMDDDDDEF